MKQRLKFATRPSKLARWQTEWVIRELQNVWPGLECETIVITTHGDRELERPLPEIGGKGLFTQELEAALSSRMVQAAVHSLKDLPIEPAEGLTIGAIPMRADARDVLISLRDETLESLPLGARIGTSSLRRSAQLLALRDDFLIDPLRGNVDTRIRKLHSGQYAAIVLAGAGVSRLGYADEITQWIPFESMLPAPGQGALAIQCRQDDSDTLSLLGALDHELTRRTVLAERNFLAGLGGGCSLPVAAYATSNGEEINLIGLALSEDGKAMIRLQANGRDPIELGRKLANQAIEQGAGALLHV
ncbi:MAG: hydroxymethylbilane synthase [Anaerolineales bacterium]|jgi:hydroxymethylbilane synthase